jgi:vacuolar-type H+-ATPase subunit H
MTNHETLISLFDTYVKENEKFTDKGVKAAGTRARKALAEFTKVAKERRKEIQDQKTAE